MALITQAEFARRKRERDTRGRIFYALCLAAVLVSLSMLGVLLSKIGLDGYSRSTELPHVLPIASLREGRDSPALVGSVFVVGIAGVMSFVLGVAAAVYLEEYAQRSRFAQILRHQHRQSGRCAVRRIRPCWAWNLRAGDALGAGHPGGLIHPSAAVLPLVIVASSEAIRAVPARCARADSGWGDTLAGGA